MIAIHLLSPVVFQKCRTRVATSEKDHFHEFGYPEVTASQKARNTKASENQSDPVYHGPLRGGSWSSSPYPPIMRVSVEPKNQANLLSWLLSWYPAGKDRTRRVLRLTDSEFSNYIKKML